MNGSWQLLQENIGCNGPWEALYLSPPTPQSQAVRGGSRLNGAISISMMGAVPERVREGGHLFPDSLTAQGDGSRTVRGKPSCESQGCQLNEVLLVTFRKTLLKKRNA